MTALRQRVLFSLGGLFHEVMLDRERHRDRQKVTCVDMEI